jgi:hypothetical protein
MKIPLLMVFVFVLILFMAWYPPKEIKYEKVFYGYTCKEIDETKAPAPCITWQKVYKQVPVSN